MLFSRAMTTLLSHIKTVVNTLEGTRPLRGQHLGNIPCIDNAYIIIEDGRIASVGPMSSLPRPVNSFAHHLDLSGRLVLPAWCDSHTHAVFAGSRETEFVDKIKGLSYAEIAARGGGILNSAAKLREASEDTLFADALVRIKELIALGTGAIEIKSGYGLSLEGELKMLRVVKRLREALPIPVKATLLAAHALPPEYRDNADGYVQMVIENIIPRAAAEKLADYIDVFCEKGFFNAEQTERICKAAAGYGLKPKLHVNQLNSIGGVQTGVASGAVSLDHLEVMTDADMDCVAQSDTIATLLPTPAFFLRMALQPARQLIEKNAIVALASDLNPGSSPSGNMNFVVALSCIQMRMLPEEAVAAATFNGACAMELQNEVGSIAVGKRANLIITKPVPSLAYLPYAFGSNLVDQVLVNGEPAN